MIPVSVCDCHEKNCEIFGMCCVISNCLSFKESISPTKKKSAARRLKFEKFGACSPTKTKNGTGKDNSNIQGDNAMHMFVFSWYGMVLQ